MEAIKQYLNSKKISFVETNDGSLMLCGNADYSTLINLVHEINFVPELEIKMSLSHLFISTK